MHDVRVRLLLFLSVFFAPWSSARAETTTVYQFGFYFSPRVVVIHPGDSVRWVWTGGSHTVTEGTDGVINGNELFSSVLNSSTQSFTWTFSPAFLAAHPMTGGRYEYFCAVHASIAMNGSVIVADPIPGAGFCYGDGSGTACPCNNNASDPVGCLNSVGKGGRLRAFGNASLAADTLTLALSGTSEGSNVLFFQGTTSVNGGAGVVFEDGLRCAGGAVIRLGIETISFGHCEYPIVGDAPIAMRGQVLAPGTRTYQAWYRDGASTCTGAASNLSNGYSVTWN